MAQTTLGEPLTMSKHLSNKAKQDWSSSKIIDDVDFKESDAKQFESLLHDKEEGAKEGSVSSMSAGHILKGIIVEITKDFVVVHVGLKSEGLVPVNEFC